MLAARDRAPSIAVGVDDACAGGARRGSARAGRHRLLRLALAGGDHLVIDGGAARLPERRPRARRRAVADAHGRAACRCSIDPGTGCYTIDAGAARSLPLDRAAQHARRRRPARSRCRPARSTGRTSPNSRVRRWRTQRRASTTSKATHDGYAPLDPPPARPGAATAICSIVADLVDGPGRTRPPSHWHIDPRWTRRRRGRRVDARAPTATRCQLVVPDGHDRALHGRRRQRPRLALAGLRPRRAGDDAARRARRERAVLDRQRLRPEPAESGRRRRVAARVGPTAGALGDAVAIRIARAASIDYVAARRAARQATRRPWRGRRPFETDARMLFCRIAGRRPSPPGAGRRFVVRRPAAVACASDAGRIRLRGRRRRRPAGHGRTRPGVRAIRRTCVASPDSSSRRRVAAPFDRDDSRALVHRMCEVIRHRGPDDEGLLRRRRGGARHAAAEHHRSRRPATSRFTTRTGRSGSSSTARSTTSASCGASSKRPATASTRRPTPRSSSTPTSSGATARSRGCAACSALAIWDARTRTLLVARDRVGIKPLHYAERERPAVFRLRDQVAARARPICRASWTSTRSITTCRSSTRRATARSSSSVRKLPPGHLLTWQRRTRSRSSGTGSCRPSETFRGIGSRRGRASCATC